MLLLANIRRLVKKKFSNHPDRFVHTLGVVKMAKHLAKQYGINKKKAMIAAYLHDFCKYDSIEYVSSLLDADELAECQISNVLYHSYGSAKYYLKYIGNDMDVFNAIKNHVFGRLYMSKLEEIILISDYTEENRKYESCIQCREILLSGDLDFAIYQSTKNVISFLTNKGIKPHPTQYEVLKLYEGKCRK